MHCLDISFITVNMWHACYWIASFQTNGGAEDLIESVNDALDSTAATISPGEGEQLINKTDITLSVEKDSKDAFLNKSVVYRKGMSLQFDNNSLTNVTEGTNMDLQVVSRYLVFNFYPFWTFMHVLVNRKSVFCTTLLYNEYFIILRDFKLNTFWRKRKSWNQLFRTNKNNKKKQLLTHWIMFI